jgi:tetratricopeptide (TPR) repeat protein
VRVAAGAFAALGLAAPQSALGAPPPAARQVRISASQALALGAQREAAGDTRTATLIYRELMLDRAPAVRAEAHFRLAKLLTAAGKLTEAAVELRRVIDEQPDASAVRIGLAQLLDRMGDVDGARRQLRAAQAGGLPRNLADYTRRYADSLRSRAPFGWTFEMAIAPDSNINRATRSDTLTTVIGDFHVADSSQARSGVGLTLGGSGFARIGLAHSLALVTRAQVSADRYRDQDFNRLSLSLGSGLEWSPGKLRLALDASGGGTRYGGRTYQRFGQATLRAFRPIGARTAASVSIDAATIDNRVNDLQDGHSFTLGASLDHALSASSAVQLSLSRGRFKAEDPGYSTRSWEAGLGGVVDLGRFTLSASAAHGGLHADERLSLFPARRKDRSNRLTLGLTSRQIQMFGFSPLVRFTMERNKSSIELYDYTRRRVEVGVTRAF